MEKKLPPMTEDQLQCHHPRVVRQGNQYAAMQVCRRCVLRLKYRPTDLAAEAAARRHTAARAHTAEVRPAAARDAPPVDHEQAMRGARVYQAPPPTPPPNTDLFRTLCSHAERDLRRRRVARHFVLTCDGCDTNLFDEPYTANMCQHMRITYEGSNNFGPRMRCVGCDVLLRRNNKANARYRTRASSSGG